MINDFAESIFDWLDDRLETIFLLFGVASVIGMAALIYAAISSSRSPTIELRKTEWECTGTRSEPTTIYIQSGKAMVPMTTYSDVCVEYKKR